MSDSKTTETTLAEQVPDKGKGKAVEPDTEEEESSDEEMGDESVMEVEEEDEDDLAEIDPSNIIQTGRRTRGNKIDYATAAQNDMADDDDEEDDDDFTAPEAEDDDAMDTK